MLPATRADNLIGNKGKIFDKEGGKHTIKKGK